MRFWFEHSSEVSLREQLVAQVTLGVLSGELAPGERLPSIRELARRYQIHANTVSAGYRQLEAEGWVASRKGSGVYVQPRSAAAPRNLPTDHLDRLIAHLFEAARRLKVPAATVVERVQAFAAPSTIARLLLVEPDPELRRIIGAELAEITPVSLLSCGFEELSGQDFRAQTPVLLLTLPSKLDRVRSLLQALQPAPRLLCLRVRSVPTSLAEHLPPAESRAGVLVGVASRWPEFLRFARTMLVAAGFAPEALVVRDAREPGWQDGLSHCPAVICDLPTAQSLPASRTIVSRILAECVAADLAAAGAPTHTSEATL